VRLCNPLGGRYKKTVRGKRAAERHEAETRTVLAAGGMAAGPLRTVTVEELREQILAAKPNLAPNTVRAYRTSLRLHLYPAAVRPGGPNPSGACGTRQGGYAADPLGAAQREAGKEGCGPWHAADRSRGRARGRA
jgi:hypothetical protein